MSGAPLYAECVAASNFSFLRGASQPGEMVARAQALGMSGIGIADRNSVAGVVRAHQVWKQLGGPHGEFRLLVGARLVFADGTPDVVAYPRDRQGWGRLTKLLTLGNRRTIKGDCQLNLADLTDAAQGMALIAMDGDAALLATLKATGCPLWLAATMPRGGADARRLAQRQRIAAQAGMPLLATNDALYASAEDRPLQDVLTCIRTGTNIQSAGRTLAANGERHLKTPAEMARLFRTYPAAITATQDVLDAVGFALDELVYDYPNEPVPDGRDPQDWLEHLVMQGGAARFPDGLPDSYRAVLDEEFRLIRLKQYACYFLTVHDIVAFARSLDPPILCQGRGSAANSLVCYFLGITPIDPVKERLLFSRFLSEQRDEPPDIDVDFEHERREEVIQYIYRRYGRERAGIAATVIRYRQRSAVREVGKALGLTEDVTARLSSTIWGSWGGGPLPEERLAEVGFDPANPELARLRAMVDRLLEYPRHLSQHVGGFVLSETPLEEIVPIHNAAMPDRTFIEWDKDDLETLGLMKVDVLALGMLTAIRKCFDMLRHHGLRDMDLASVPHDDQPTYAMLRRADSIGTFQVESRAQIAMLPRMKPRILYDLVIQVAIVRPGPIQGGMVHPYLRRRNKEEKVTYPGPPGEIKSVLEKTLGVPLFQEQAMKLAIVAAGFTPAEADGLRRAMATFRNHGTVQHYQDRLVEGMVKRGYPRDFAERCFEQIKGFGEYGFPESHAQAFGWLAYVSSWLKCHYPAAFTAALLNSQPMGFYAPAQLVRDAEEHGVVVLPIDVNASDWDNKLERVAASQNHRHPELVSGSMARNGLQHGAGGESRPWMLESNTSEAKQVQHDESKDASKQYALRLGFRQITGFRAEWAAALIAARATAPIMRMEEVAHRVGLPPRALHLLADADAFGSLGHDRRAAGWEVRRVPPVQLPLFAALDAPELRQEADPALPKMSRAEEVVVDYQTQRLSLKGHPMQFLRETLAAQGVVDCATVNAARDGTKLKVAGVVLIRQRPGKGNAVFITIEDESGVVNALLWSSNMENQRRAVMAARMMILTGEVQRSKEDVVHFMVDRVTDASDLLGQLSDHGEPTTELMRGDSIRHPAYSADTSGGHQHPRDVRVIPRSRDFH